MKKETDDQNQPAMSQLPDILKDEKPPILLALDLVLKSYNHVSSQLLEVSQEIREIRTTQTGLTRMVISSFAMQDANRKILMELATQDDGPAAKEEFTQFFNTSLEDSRAELFEKLEDFDPALAAAMDNREIDTGLSSDEE